MMITNETDSKAAVGYLVGGQGAPAPTLSISCPDSDTMAVHWSILRLCSHWKLRAKYQGEQATLHLEGWGEPIPIGPASPWFGCTSQACAAPAYRAYWKLKSDGVKLFMAQCKRSGYFILLAAINMQLNNEHRPVLALLYRGKS